MRRRAFLVVALAFVRPGPVRAGMPSPTLADVRRAVVLAEPTRLRLEVLSFFLLGLLAAAGMVWALWNSLRHDFPRLPRLSFGKALGVVVLWGLLFVLVLTMISGARELLTPGAWEKIGLTYRLADEPPPIERAIRDRTEALERLGAALVEYARGHGGNFPPVGESARVLAGRWVVPNARGATYGYVGGRLIDEESSHLPRPLAYEPEEVGNDRLVLMTDGSVRWMPADALRVALDEKGP